MLIGPPDRVSPAPPLVDSPHETVGARPGPLAHAQRAGAAAGGARRPPVPLDRRDRTGRVRAAPGPGRAAGRPLRSGPRPRAGPPAAGVAPRAAGGRRAPARLVAGAPHRLAWRRTGAARRRRPARLASGFRPGPARALCGRRRRLLAGGVDERSRVRARAAVPAAEERR